MKEVLHHGKYHNSRLVQQILISTVLAWLAYCLVAKYLHWHLKCIHTKKNVKIFFVFLYNNIITLNITRQKVYSTPLCYSISFTRRAFLLTLKAPSKIAADDTFIIFTFYLLKKIRLDVSCESSAKQRIHMKYKALFYQKKQWKIFQTVVCCSRHWRFKS